MALRGAVLGLGQIGRNHARLLQAMPGVELVGAVDVSGDPSGALHDPGILHASVEDLLAASELDFAVVALPTAGHPAAALALAQAGVAVLVEKPLADTVAEGQRIIDACEAAGIPAAVGHVERFNPALAEMRRRMADGQLGEIFIVTTERSGPFPDRVRDVGVVMDLATHDLDLVRWLGGGPIASVSALTSHRMRRAHEDLVSITGRLDDGMLFNALVDRVSPTKVRRTRVLGERGMLLADTLTADLTFFENGTVATEWPATRQLRGVTEGDATRYALAKREPLLIELEAFCALVRGDAGAPVVSLRDGLEAVRYAEAVLESAESGETVKLSP